MGAASVVGHVSLICSLEVFYACELFGGLSFVAYRPQKDNPPNNYTYIMETWVSA